MKVSAISVIALCLYSFKLTLCAPTPSIIFNNEDDGDIGVINRVTNIETESVNNKNSSGANGPTSTLNFLRKFGYLEPLESNSSETLYSEDTISEAIRLMQRFGALPETGRLDNATLLLLTKPRCGVPDVVHSRNKRFVLNSKGWNKRTLSYRIDNVSPKLEETDVSKDIIQALKVWGNYAHLRFVNKTEDADNVDISISFARGHHGDSYPFDGPGGTLAHAFYPNSHGGLAGDIHFDEDENWYSPSSASGPTDASNNGRRGISFLSVATHELGHSLGLGHSHVLGSVMFPYYQARESENPRLDYDDIMALYQLYILRNVGNGDEGPEVTSEIPSTTTRAIETTPSTSEIPTFTTTTTESTSTSITPWTSITSKTTKFPDWDLPSTTERTTSPTTTKDASIPDLCKDRFDSISFLRNEIFVFTGEYMWRFKKRGELARGDYPVKTSRLFPVVKGLKKIDAAFERESDGKIIFISGKFYWTFDGLNNGNSGPLPLTDFDLPASLDGIDTAFIWGKNDMTYFFRDNMYWKYNETAKSIGNDYPKDIGRWRGVPDRLTSVMKYKDGLTYFFKEDKFWRFDDAIVHTDEGFPIDTFQIWFNC